MSILRIAWPALWVSANCVAPALAQEQEEDLNRLDLATLMQMNVEVTTASKSAQSIYEIAAPIYVITAEDLRRSGATTIPEALRLAPGVMVGQIDQTRWVVGMRGFGWEFNNKVLILLDGRATYTPLNSSVYWEALDVPVEDIDRIEVIRGPGDARWGSHAINGIVNIITRPAAATQGTLLTSALDTESGHTVGVRNGGRVSESTQYRAYARYLSRGDFEMTGNAPRLGDFYTTRAGVRVDSQHGSGDDFVFIGDVQHARQGAIVPVTGNPRVRYDPLEWSLLGRWERSPARGISQQAQLSFDYIDHMPLLERRDTFDFAYQAQFPTLRAQTWTLGASYKNTSDEIAANLSIQPERMTQDIYGAFAHDRIALGDKTALLVSAQFERNPFTGWETQPGLQLLYRPQEKRSYWFSAGRAVRAPLRVEDGFNVDLALFPGGVLRLLGNRHLRSEVVTSTQAGMRMAVGDDVYLDFTVFYNQYRHLVVQSEEAPYFEPLPPPGNAIFPVRYTNSFAGHTQGAEAALKAQINPRWRVAASYSLYDESLASMSDGFGEFTAVEHQFQLHSSATLLPAVEWNIDFYYVGPLTTGLVGDYYKLDSQLAWTASRGLQLRLGIKDAFSPRRREVGVNSIDVPAIIPRRAYLQAYWQF